MKKSSEEADSEPGVPAGTVDNLSEESDSVIDNLTEASDNATVDNLNANPADGEDTSLLVADADDSAQAESEEGEAQDAAESGDAGGVDFEMTEDAPTEDAPSVF